MYAQAVPAVLTNPIWMVLGQNLHLHLLFKKDQQIKKKHNQISKWSVFMFNIFNAGLSMGHTSGAQPLSVTVWAYLSINIYLKHLFIYQMLFIYREHLTFCQ